MSSQTTPNRQHLIPIEASTGIDALATVLLFWPQGGTFFRRPAEKNGLHNLSGGVKTHSWVVKMKKLIYWYDNFRCLFIFVNLKNSLPLDTLSHPSKVYTQQKSARATKQIFSSLSRCQHHRQPNLYGDPDQPDTTIEISDRSLSDWAECRPQSAISTWRLQQIMALAFPTNQWFPL